MGREKALLRVGKGQKWGIESECGQKLKMRRKCGRSFYVRSIILTDHSLPKNNDYQHVPKPESPLFHGTCFPKRQFQLETKRLDLRVSPHFLLRDKKKKGAFPSILIWERQHMTPLSVRPFKDKTSLSERFHNCILHMPKFCSSLEMQE